MRVLVCGGRDFTDKDLLERTLDGFEITTIIEGEARGADRLAGEYGRRHRIHVLPFPALWNEHGNAAGPIRNAKMLVEGRPDVVIAFPGGRGTSNMIEQAEKAGVKVIKV